MVLTLAPLLAMVSAMMAYLYWNHYPGLGFFDASEFATLIRSGGLPHAPGYPIYLYLGKFFNFVCEDPFLAQHLISLFSLPVTVAALYQTLKISERAKEQELQHTAFALTLLMFLSSFYLKLFTVLPEVFVLNLAFFAVLIWRATCWSLDSSQKNAFYVFLTYGLGACHHHTLALTLPGVTLLFYLKRRQLDWQKQVLPVITGLVVGLLPFFSILLISREVTETAPFTSHIVRNLGDLLHIFFRLSYGTFNLAKGFETDFGAELTTIAKACYRNFNGVGLLVFALWFLPQKISTNSKNRSKIELSWKQKLPMGFESRWLSVNFEYKLELNPTHHRPPV